MKRFQWDKYAKPSDITSCSDFNARRTWLKGSMMLAMMPGISTLAKAADLGKLNKAYVPKRAVTGRERFESYNNFYELGTAKTDPKRNAAWMEKTLEAFDPWTIEVSGEVNKPGKIGMEEILKFAMEERIYRLRCVERWSMVVPWNGFELNALLKRFDPTSKAKYVSFTTVFDPKNLKGQRFASLEWPYTEGLRMDEAMHPLTMIAVGAYGQPLTPQNGAPIRLVVPWKYGYKSIKSIQSIKLVEKMPETAWNKAAPHEYGFYSNVNPDVHHPRWLQSRERLLGVIRKQKTLLFNGYSEVADLYKGMDLKKFH